DEGGIRPKKDNFFSYKKSAYQLADTTLIDTNSIYIASLGVMDDLKTYYAYYRFYSSGQLIVRMTDHEPTLEEINNIKTGTVGYYKINSRKKLKLEYLGVLYNGKCELRYAKFDQNGDILIYDLNPSVFYGWVPKNSKTTRYKKMKFKGMTHLKPDW
ncbi:MAG: hypothetical protein ACXVNF_06825, partial [Neobacillus sp.]